MRECLSDQSTRVPADGLRKSSCFNLENANPERRSFSCNMIPEAHPMLSGMGVKFPFLSYRASGRLSQYGRVESVAEDDILKNVYDNVIVSILFIVASLQKSGSMKKKTGISTVSPAFNLCSSKQKHCILLK